jgi:hypothetical protein
MQKLLNQALIVYPAKKVILYHSENAKEKLMKKLHKELIFIKILE